MKILKKYKKNSRKFFFGIPSSHATKSSSSKSFSSVLEWILISFHIWANGKSSVLKVMRNETRASGGRASESSHSLALANNSSCLLAARSRYSKFSKRFARSLAAHSPYFCEHFELKNQYFFGTVIGQIKPVHISLADFITEASENQRRTDNSWSSFDESTRKWRVSRERASSERYRCSLTRLEILNCCSPLARVVQNFQRSFSPSLALAHFRRLSKHWANLFNFSLWKHNSNTNT